MSLRPPLRITRSLVVALCLLFGGVGTALVEADTDPPSASARESELSPETRAAIERGLAWLAEHQGADGSYGVMSHYGPHVGITGLAGLAFIADGNTPGRGRYGRQVERCVGFIVAHSSESGLLAAETSHGPMYGHGFATLFLAEVYGMEQDARVREVLRKAVRLIVSTQNEEGGWRYQPVRADADISVTVCQVMALRAARNTGVYVDKVVIDRAVEYVRRSQNLDGGFRYMLTSGRSAFSRSAAGVATLQYAGIYQGEDLQRGLQYLEHYVPPYEQQPDLTIIMVSTTPPRRCSSRGIATGSAGGPPFVLTSWLSRRRRASGWGRRARNTAPQWR